MWQQVPEVKSAWLLSYDTRRYPFAECLSSRIFCTPRLERLHEVWAARTQKTLGYADNLKLRALMQQLPLDSGFYRIYERFSQRLLARLFGGPISYSSRPKMRVHLAGTGSVSRWHRDADITGRLDQVNIWLPVTNTFGTNTLWVESDYGRGDHRPIAVSYGQALFFDGGLLSHGTVANDSGATRISFDLRFASLRIPPPAVAARILQHRPVGIEMTISTQRVSIGSCMQ